jgi:hypothetical protein
MILLQIKKNKSKQSFCHRLFLPPVKVKNNVMYLSNTGLILTKQIKMSSIFNQFLKNNARIIPKFSKIQPFTRFKNLL